MEILKSARPKLSVDTIEDFKDELYAILQRYNDKVNVHANARKKVKKLLDNFNSSFSSVEMRKFVYELEYHEEVRVNVTSAYTVEVLKVSLRKFGRKFRDGLTHQQFFRINERIRNVLISYEEIQVKIQRRRIMCEKSYEALRGTRCKRQCRQEHIPEYLADVFIFIYFNF